MWHYVEYVGSSQRNRGTRTATCATGPSLRTWCFFVGSPREVIVVHFYSSHGEVLSVQVHSSLWICAPQLPHGRRNVYSRVLALPAVRSGHDQVAHSAAGVPWQ